MNRSDAKLKESVDSLLEEEIKAIPEDKTIKEEHMFSKTFEKDMKRLIKKNKIRKMHSSYKVLAACAVLVLVIVVGKNVIWDSERENHMDMATEGMVEESKEETAVTEDAVEESVAEESGGAETAYDYSEEMKQSWIKSSYGDEITVADMKEEPIGMKVSVLDKNEEGVILYEQIQNNTDSVINYIEGSYMLEVWNNDGWYVISTSEESQIYMLEPGSRYANNIIIKDAELYEGYQYRLLSMFDGEMKASMFIVE